MAIAIQVQITLPGDEAYTGLRICLADLFIPILGLAVLASLLLKKSVWPHWHSKWTLPAMGLMSAVIVMGIVNGYFYNGEWSFWALFNKGLGWPVLLSYFLLGAWITTNCRTPCLQGFTRSFAYFFLLPAVALAGTLFLEHVLTKYYLSPLEYPIQGFMDNRNLYALLLVCCGGYIYMGHLKAPKLFPAWLVPAYSFFIPFFMMYNGSRVSWIVALVFLAGLIALYRKSSLKKILLPFAVATTICAAILASGLQDNNVFRGPITNLSDSYEYVTNTAPEEIGEDADAYPSKMYYVGDSNRLVIIKHSLGLWSTSPVIGVGIGTSQKYQTKDFGQILSVIDSTPLWILTEMGLVGLIVFSGFFIFCFVHIWKASKIYDGVYGVILTGALFSMVMFAVTCLLHELTYTRFIWLLLGLAMASPASMRQTPQEH